MTENFHRFFQEFRQKWRPKKFKFFRKYLAITFIVGIYGNCQFAYGQVRKCFIEKIQLLDGWTRSSILFLRFYNRFLGKKSASWNSNFYKCIQ